MADSELDLEDILNAIDDDIGVADFSVEAVLGDIDDALSGLKGAAPAAKPVAQQTVKSTLGISSLLRGSMVGGKPVQPSAKPTGRAVHPVQNQNITARRIPHVQQPALAVAPTQREMSDDEILAELLAADSDDEQFDSDIATHLQGLLPAADALNQSVVEEAGERLDPRTQPAHAPAVSLSPSASHLAAGHHAASLLEHSSRRSSVASDGGAQSPDAGDQAMNAALAIARKYAHGAPAPAASNGDLERLLAAAEADMLVDVSLGPGRGRVRVSHEEAMAEAEAALQQARVAGQANRSPASTVRQSVPYAGRTPSTPLPASGDDASFPSRGHRPAETGELDLEAILQAYSGVATATPVQTAPARQTEASFRSRTASSVSKSGEASASRTEIGPSREGGPGNTGIGVPGRPTVPALSSPVDKQSLNPLPSPSSPALPGVDPRTCLVLHSSTALHRAVVREMELLKAGNGRIGSPLASRKRFRPRLPAHVLRAQAAARALSLASRGLTPLSWRRGSIDSGTGSITSASVMDGTGGRGGGESPGLPCDWLLSADSAALTGILTAGRGLSSPYRSAAPSSLSLPLPLSVGADGQLQASSSEPMHVIPSVTGILRLGVLPIASDMIRRSVKALTQGQGQGEKGVAQLSLGLPTAMTAHARFLAVGTSRSLVLVFDTVSQELRLAFNARGLVVATPATLTAAATSLGISAGGAAVGAAGAAAVGATDGAVTALDVIQTPGGTGGGGVTDLLAVGYQSGRVGLWAIDASSPGKTAQLRVAEGYHRAPIAALRFTSSNPSSPTLLSADVAGVVNFLSFSRMLGLRWSVEAKCVLDGSKTGPIMAVAVLLPPVDERLAPNSAGSTNIMTAAFTSSSSGPTTGGPSTASTAPPYGTLVALSTRDATYFLVTAPELSVVHKWARPEGVPDGVVPALAWARGRVHGGAPLDALDERRTAAAAAAALTGRGPAAAVAILEQAAAKSLSLLPATSLHTHAHLPQEVTTSTASPPASRRSSLSGGTETSNNPFAAFEPLRKAEVGSPVGKPHPSSPPEAKGRGVGGVVVAPSPSSSLRRAAAAAAYRAGSTLPGHGVVTAGALPVIARAWGGRVQFLQVQPPGGYAMEQTNLAHTMMEGTLPVPWSPTVPVASAVGPPPTAPTPAPGGAVFGSLTTTLMNAGGLDGVGVGLPAHEHSLQGGAPHSTPTRALEFVLADDLAMEDGSYVFSVAWLTEGVLAYTATGGPPATPDRLVLLDTAACEEMDVAELVGLRVVASPPSHAPGQGAQAGGDDPLSSLPSAVRTRLTSAHSASLCPLDGSLYILASDRILSARLHRWSERANAMVAQGEWLAALALACDTYDAVTSAHAASVAAAERQAKWAALRATALARIAAQSGATLHMGGGGGSTGGAAAAAPSPSDGGGGGYDAGRWERLRAAPGPVRKGTPLGDELGRLIMSYLAEMGSVQDGEGVGPELSSALGILPPLRRHMLGRGGAGGSNTSPSDRHWALLAAVCLDYCTTIARPDLLFGECYDMFTSSGQSAALLEACEPYILSERLPALPPLILKAFVAHYRAQGALSSVERCLLHLDLAALDVDAAVRTCSRFRLYSALVYVLNVGLRDYTLPLDLLLCAVFDEQAGAAGARLGLGAGDAGPPSRRASLDFLQESGPEAMSSPLLTSPEGKSSVREREVLPMSSGERAALGYTALLYAAYCITGRSFPHGKRAVLPLPPLLPSDLSSTITDLHAALAVAAQYSGIGGMEKERGAGERGAQDKAGQGRGKGSRPAPVLSTWDLLFAPPERVIRAKHAAAVRDREGGRPGGASRAASSIPMLSTQQARYGTSKGGLPPPVPPPLPLQRVRQADRSQADRCDEGEDREGPSPTPASLRADMLAFLFTPKPDRFPSPAATMLSSSGLLAGAAALAELPGPYPRVQAFLRFDTVALLTVLGRLVTDAADAVLHAVAVSEGVGGLAHRRGCLPGDAPRIRVPPLPPGPGPGPTPRVRPSVSPPPLPSFAAMLGALAEAASALALAGGYRGGGAEDRAAGRVLPPSSSRRPSIWCEPRLTLVLAFIAHTACRCGPGAPPLLDCRALPDGVLDGVLGWLTSPAPMWRGPGRLQVSPSPSASRVTGPPIKGMVGVMDCAHTGVEGACPPSDPLLTDPMLHACLTGWEVHGDGQLYGLTEGGGGVPSSEGELLPCGGLLMDGPFPTPPSWSRETLLIRFLRTVPLSPLTAKGLYERVRGADMHRAAAVCAALCGDAAGVVDAYLRCGGGEGGQGTSSPARVFRFIRAYVGVVSVGLGGMGGGSEEGDTLEGMEEREAGGEDTARSRDALASALIGPGLDREPGGSHERALALAAKAALMGSAAAGMDSRAMSISALPPSASASALRTLRTHVMRVLPKLVQASESATAALVIDTFPEKSGEVIDSLERFPHMQYAYLKQFLRKAGIIGDTPSPSPTTAVPALAMQVSADIHLRYIDLLCVYEVGGVLPYLSGTTTVGYPLDATLALVRDKHHLSGPTAFLLERTGDVRGAQELGLKALDEAVAALATSLRHASLAEHRDREGAAGGTTPLSLPSLHSACETEVTALRAALAAAIALCTRCSSGARFNDAEAERLWLACLDRLVAAQMEAKSELAAASAASAAHEERAAEGRPLEDATARNIADSVIARYAKGPASGAAIGKANRPVTGSTAGPTTGPASTAAASVPSASLGVLLSTRFGAAAISSSASALLATLSNALKLTLDAMKGVVPLNVVMAKVLAQHSRAELSEFGDTLGGMLSGYAFDVRVLGTANTLMAGDLFRQVKRLHGGYAAGVAPSRTPWGACSGCTLRLYSGGVGTGAGGYVLVYGCGHAFHEACVSVPSGDDGGDEGGSASGCPLCSQGQGLGDEDGEKAGRAKAKAQGKERRGRAVTGAILGRAALFGGRQRGSTAGMAEVDGAGQGGEAKDSAPAFTEDEDGDVHVARLAAARARRSRPGVSVQPSLGGGERDTDRSVTRPTEGRVVHRVLRTDVPAANRSDARKVPRRDGAPNTDRDTEPLFTAGLDVPPFDFDSF